MEETKFQINILPVAEGDCIHLRFFSNDKWYNLIIDSGPGPKKDIDPEDVEVMEHNLPFLKLLKSIKKRPDEVVDLLCFTHIDDDHIEAAKVVFSKDYGLRNLIREVWINIPEETAKATTPAPPKGLEKVSAKNAQTLYNYLSWYESRKELVCKTKILAGTVFLDQDVKVSAVLPNESKLTESEAVWPAPLKKTHTAVLDPVSTKKKSDQSKTNGASIVLQIEAYGWRMLFTGDTFAVNLRDMVKELEANGENVHYDLVKLPHHGSSANISIGMLKKLQCNRFVISADGQGTVTVKNGKTIDTRRPDAATIEVLGKYARTNGDVTLYGNYAWTYIQQTNSVQIVTLTGKETMLTDSISIKSEEPKC